MACPTCGHTMQRLGCQFSECQGTFWCPRCGTLLVEREQAAPPDVVRRCRQFERVVHDGQDHSPHYLQQQWVTIGLAEAINPPETRLGRVVTIDPNARAGP